MVEPKEDSFCSKVMQKEQKFAAKVMEESKQFPGEVIEAAQKRIESFHSLKSEIDVDVARVVELFGKVRGKIKDNIVSKENPNGLLTGKQQEYLQCLKSMNFPDLEQMLRQDELKWAQNLEIKKKEAEQVNQELQSLLQKQKAAIDDFMRRSMSLYSPACNVGMSFTLKKLPMWGEQVAADEVNFEWPTQEMVNRWPHDVTLKTITFSTWHAKSESVSSVQCTISTGEQSPLFDTAGREQNMPKTINFEANQSVRSVQASSEDPKRAMRVTFLDKNGAIIDCFNPKSLNREGPIHKLQDNEELIGIYGVRNKPRSDSFSSFGFIVKVQQVV